MEPGRRGGGVGGLNAGLNLGRAVKDGGVVALGRAGVSAGRVVLAVLRLRVDKREVLDAGMTGFGLKARGRGEVGVSMIRSVAYLLLDQLCPLACACHG